MTELGLLKLAAVPVPSVEAGVPDPAKVVTAVERLSSIPCIEPPICSTTLNELNVRVLLTFPRASVTVIVQFEYVPSLKEFRVTLVFPLIADVVPEEQEPPYEIVPASSEEKI